MKSCTYGVALALLMLLAASGTSLARTSQPLQSDATWHRQLQASIRACGASEPFVNVDCKYVASAKDLVKAEITYHPPGTCANYIQCGKAGMGVPELYTITVEAWEGTDEDTGNPKHYARGWAVSTVNPSKRYTYCWKQNGGYGGGCACLCAVIIKGTALGNRPECGTECRF
jgi:hypothetical protein